MDNAKKRPKGPDIGLHQARRLCQLDDAERLAFIAEGLPVILRSAQGFWAAAEKLQAHSREAKVLENYADEEAAKILILVDAVRCPPKLIASRLNKIVGWFYNHLARLIYAEAVSWKPTHLAELREYVDQQRHGHYLEGHAGEYIAPNWAIYQRESLLYADVEAYQDGTLEWSAPRDPPYGHFGSFRPRALLVAEAMEQVGMFTTAGLKAVSEIWGSLEYREKEDHHDGRKLTEQLLTRLHDEGLILDTAKAEHAGTLYNEWQIPMYNLEFSLIPVSLEELEAEQEREFWSMAGDPR
ncbi:hypothetical protein CI1B_23460 [Bradyrhizobium ivorense]|uniref:Uncharacterized protein n=1 Tax=Bradyrhizobium ivorense TaxID=2511166 RepID=A0A508T4V4_9BRAD|nr:hypothetical protein [Bradyrhizobium ivorense]VIO68764.1 hypothetical protein CI1B_23460 [Bradyrhizobium ivorense]